MCLIRTAAAVGNKIQAHNPVLLAVGWIRLANCIFSIITPESSNVNLNRHLEIIAP